MAKNVIIAEGSTGRRMPDVSKVLTLRPTTGSDLWVPVDERLSRTKYITKNGTYYATEEELYAFSKVTVNVPGGVQGVTTPTVTVDLSNTSPDAIPDINPYTGLQNDVNISVEQPDTLTSPTAMPQMNGIPGSTISGIDPDTGISYTVGVNPDGTISKSENPNAIHITKTPDKMDYSDGETIDYTGIQVMLYKSYNEGPDGANSVLFRDDRYGDSIIPFDELIFPNSTASIVSGDVSIVTSEIKTSGTIRIESISENSILGLARLLVNADPLHTFAQNSAYNAFWQQVNSLNSSYGGCAAVGHRLVAGASGNGFRTSEFMAIFVFEGVKAGDTIQLGTQPSGTVHGCNIQCRGDGIPGSVHTPFGNRLPSEVPNIYSGTTKDYEQDHFFYEYDYLASNINARFLYANDVPVNWESPYDGRILSDTFKLSISDQQSSNDGYSGSGGGSF